MNNKNLDALFTGLTGTPKSSFCTIVQSDILRKIRIIANREGLQIKEVVYAAFEKAIKSYERKNGPVDGRMKGDAKNLF